MLSNTCRICAQNVIYKIHLSEKSGNVGLKLIEVYNEITQLSAKLEDALPQQICTMCASELQFFYDFLRRAKENDVKLRQITASNVSSSVNNDDTETVLVSSEFEFSVDPLENLNDADVSTENHKSMHDILAVGNVTEIADNNEFSIGFDENSNRDVEHLIFPIGHNKCSICGKRYFTAMGLKVHMEVHKQIPLANKKSKCLANQSKGQRKDTQLKDKSFQQVPRVMRKTKSTAKVALIDEETEILCYEQPQSEHVIVSQLNLTATKPKKQYPCKICGKLMISASKLRYHMVMHTGEKDYLCTICPKAYSTIYALKYHMRTHTGERPYECKFCGDKFLRPTTLKSHMRRHTGERPYGCNICGKRFIQHSSMTTHIKLNHMAKTIPCPHCDKKYARKTDLSTHLLSHTGDKPFSCSLCPSRFIRQANLNKHTYQHHTEKKIKPRQEKKSKNQGPVVVDQQN